jgi:branched-subunit amino acid transport protein
MTAWLVITAIGVGSYAMRAVMLALVGLKPLPARIDTAMRHVGPAAIAALTVTIALTRAGTIQPLPIAELAAIAAGFITVRRTRNVMHAITVGLPTLWLIALLGP